MSETHGIERRGISALTEFLRNSQRVVTVSERKTFDLVVDGLPAEVKCKQLPWDRLDFIGLTDNQRDALERGERFILFIVCNLKGPGQPEIIEILSELLCNAKFDVERTHYIYRKQLRDIVSRKNEHRPAVALNGIGK